MGWGSYAKKVYNTDKKAIIFGIKRYKLSKKEKIFLKKSRPWGIILFSRNIKNLSQLRKLVTDIKKIFADKKYPILIDQEGGKVSRLNKIVNLEIFFCSLRVSQPKKFPAILELFSDFVFITLSLLNLLFSTK